jgi:MYXO-CTERM domain-containing protein
MRTLRASLLLWLTILACAPSRDTPLNEGLPPTAYVNDTARPNGFRPNPAFVPIRAPIEVQRSALRQEGEVIVVLGDARTVSSNGVSFGITDDNIAAIIQDVLAQYPDVFDTIQIYLSFLDEASVGAAYYVGIANSVHGIGVEEFNVRSAYGLPDEGRLSGFSNMNEMTMFGGLPDLAEPLGFYYAVIAQELSHRWLMNMQHVDTTGVKSSAFLGRDDAHWSALVHAYGSCQDGVFWIDNGDGTFTHDGESDRGWAPLDRYAMGLIGKDEVEPFFYLAEATLNGEALDKESHFDLTRGDRVRATRIDVDVEDVIAAMGPRDPPVMTETPYYRAAFVLVTAPEQSRNEWQPYLEALQEVQAGFPETWKTWTGGRGAICTKVSELCPEPVINLERTQVFDANDSLIAPGETVELEVAIRNDGIGTTRELLVALDAVSPGVEVHTAPQTISEISGGQTLTLPARFQLAIAGDVPCASVVRLALVATTAEGPKFTTTIDLEVGTRTLAVDLLDEAPDWNVDPDGDDTVTAGAWELGEPDFVSSLGVVTQPGEDHSPGESKLSFHTGARKGSFFASYDLDGRSTLESPIFALRDARDPSLVFYYWHLAIDFAQQSGPMPVPGADLIVSGSNDGGETWEEMARFTEDTKEWTRASVRIKDTLELTNRMRFRFVVEDTTMSGTVEAGVDDLEVVDYLPECPLPGGEPDAGAMPPPPRMRDEEGGCGCASTNASSGALSLLVLAASIVWAKRRR